MSNFVMVDGKAIPLSELPKSFPYTRPTRNGFSNKVSPELSSVPRPAQGFRVAATYTGADVLDRMPRYRG